MEIGVSQTISERSLPEIAKALAVTDPDRAERIARSLTDKSSQTFTLAEIARALAATDPDRAERIARSITDEGWQSVTLAEIAKFFDLDFYSRF